jgi:hypothetical protein
VTARSGINNRAQRAARDDDRRESQ